MAEPACWRRIVAPGGAFTLRPDAYAEVTTGAESRLAWLEVDRGTQSVPVTIARKVSRYCAAALALAAAGEPIPRVLFIVDAAPRRNRIAAAIPTWASREGIDASNAERLFAVGTLRDVVENLVEPR